MQEMGRPDDQPTVGRGNTPVSWAKDGASGKLATSRDAIPHGDKHIITNVDGECCKSERVNGDAYVLVETCGWSTSAAAQAAYRSSAGSVARLDGSRNADKDAGEPIDFRDDDVNAHGFAPGSLPEVELQPGGQATDLVFDRRPSFIECFVCRSRPLQLSS
ncbi:hypothetical protein GWI33_006573 [Rhynchophorus ferrugineus]|uniref:Uncharacterized protein n=1 Tax=Rhynchophorus ferrugineus TaxID=354439 RepID=A0A834IES1_RHYFE|nr:hypothetical protein GWI33_006573 [Rhynchophorus ferrugineus]